jgi:hypothetical protein
MPALRRLAKSGATVMRQLRISAARSKHAPTLTQRRDKLMGLARLATPIVRMELVAMARQVNGVLVRSHQRATWRVAEFQRVLDSLS